jgi:pimeloyl-ACP methyl ester carboxylesterase
MAEFAADVERMRSAIAEDRSALLGSMKLPESDREIVRSMPEEAFVALAEAFRQGVDGLVDDFIAFTRPWGFDPRAATAPVVVSYGEHDVNVPAGHGRWLGANLPVAEVRVSADAGHLMTPDAGFALLAEAAAWPAGRG